VNRVLAAAARQVTDVTFHDLYEAYSDFDIDVRHDELERREEDRDAGWDAESLRREFGPTSAE
jgi:hypothetical protein